MAPDTNFWDGCRGIIRSKKGGWLIGKGAFCHGKEMNRELMGKASFFQVHILNATGRWVEKRLADWFEAVYIGMSWPDARIWCNNIGALGGTMRISPVAATAAGIMASDSRNYGPGTAYGVDFILHALTKNKNGKSVQEIIADEAKRQGAKPKIVGYARPIVKGDERLSEIFRVQQELGFPVGDHLCLALEIDRFLVEHYDETMNFNGYVSAFLADQGFNAQQAYQVFSTMVASGVTACYVDAFERPPESFLPMRCEDIDYQGPPPRPVPLPED